MSVRLVLNIAAVALVAALLPFFFDGGWAGWLVTVPGTVLHEMAHYGFALLLDGSPGTFSVLPAFSDGRMVSYGQVTFIPNWWNAATVALAPVMVAHASIFVTALGSRLSLPANAVCIWVAAAGFYSASPSIQDWGVALQYPTSFIPAGFIFVISTLIWWKLTAAALNRWGRSSANVQ